MVFTPDFWEKKCEELNYEEDVDRKRYWWWVIQTVLWTFGLTISAFLLAFPLQNFIVNGVDITTVDFMTKFIQNTLSDIHFIIQAYQQWFNRVIQAADNVYWFVPLLPFVIGISVLHVGLKINPYRKIFYAKKSKYRVYSNDSETLY